VLASRFFLVLALLALSLAGCKGVPDLLSLVHDKPANGKPDPSETYDPYALLGRATVPDDRAATPADTCDPYKLLDQEFCPQP
jgi:hypothetical protein